MLKDCSRVVVCVSAVLFFGFDLSGQIFTAQVGTPASPPTPLVSHGDVWRFHKGTNAPVSGWTTNADGTLDAAWGSGPGGFGYADNLNETSLVQTVLSDMLNRYTTVYFRRSFQVATPIDPSVHLQLTMDYDDGFVAYLDGAEVKRANAPGVRGVEPAFNATAPVTHESSRGNASSSPQPAETYDLGTAATLLSPGTHVLAILGLNQSIGSSDLIQIADLSLTGSGSGVTAGTFFTQVNSNSVIISGSNTLASSTRVVVNGDDAALNSGTGRWSKNQPLASGVNKLFIAALNSTGSILSSTNITIVSQVTSTNIAGVLPLNSHWDSSMGIIHVTANAIVPPTGSLTVDGGATVLLAPGVSIQATNAALTISATAASPAYFLPADGNTFWGELVISGSNGVLTAEYADTTAGHWEALNGATASIQDCYIHDYMQPSPFNTPIIHTSHAASLVMRRNHVQRYYEHLIQFTPVLIEDGLCENIIGDGIDFDAGPPGSAIRRCTLRHGDLGNVDAIDLGEASINEFTDGVIVERCLMWDFPFDKGVSLGIARNIIVRSNIVYQANSGVAVKDSSTAEIYNNTFVSVAVGINLYKKPGTATQDGGHAHATNNIIWATTTNIFLDALSTITIGYSDIDGAGVYPGTGNFNSDPLFVDAPHRNYRVGSGSPTIGVASDAGNIGATYPVGGIPGAPLNLAAINTSSQSTRLVWVDDSENEDGFVVQRSVDGASWQFLAAVGPEVTNYVDGSAALNVKYYYRVQATNAPGVSPFSNLASGTSQLPSSDIRIDSIQHVSGNTFEIHFTAAANQSYTLQYRTYLGAADTWHNLHNFASDSVTRAITYPDDTAGATQRFYQLVSPEQ
jgi:hypothetical protein